MGPSPGIGFRGDDGDRRAWVTGSAFDVWQVVDAYRDVGSVEAMVAEGTLSARQIGIALAYYERFPEEIDAAIACNRRSLVDLQAEFPFVALRGSAA